MMSQRAAANPMSMVGAAKFHLRDISGHGVMVEVAVLNSVWTAGDRRSLPDRAHVACQRLKPRPSR